MLPNIAYATWKTILKHLNYVQCLNIAPIEKAWFITPTEKAWFYVRLFFELIIAMVKDKKYSIKDTISIKIISFMLYMKCTRIM